MVKGVAHIGVATRSIEEGSGFYRLLGLEITAVEVREPDRVRVAMIPAGNVVIELLEPLDETSPVARFLARRGPGIHHLALAVDSVDESLKTLAGAGVELVDRVSREGAAGHRIAFLHPSATGGILIELSDLSGENQ